MVTITMRTVVRNIPQDRSIVRMYLLQRVCRATGCKLSDNMRPLGLMLVINLRPSFRQPSLQKFFMTALSDRDRDTFEEFCRKPESNRISFAVHPGWLLRLFPTTTGSGDGFIPPACTLHSRGTASKLSESAGSRKSEQETVLKYRPG